MDRLEMAKALLEQNKNSNPGQTTTSRGIATTDSENGYVMVDFGGDTVSPDDDQSVECETTFKVYENDEVIVSLIGADGTGKTPIVVGVVGRGDEIQDEIDGVKNYFWADQYGAHVSTEEQSVNGANVLLDANSLDIRVGSSNSEADQSVLASFGREVTVGSRRSGRPVGSYSQVFGRDCTASGMYSHAEGAGTIAAGWGSHAEGSDSSALGKGSHAEGTISQATADGAHAEGSFCEALGLGSHAQGRQTMAAGEYSMTSGRKSSTIGEASFACGQEVNADNDYSSVLGKYNVIPSSGTLKTATRKMFFYLDGSVTPMDTSFLMLFASAVTNVAITTKDTGDSVSYDTAYFEPFIHALHINGIHIPANSGGLVFSITFEYYVNEDNLFVIGNGLTSYARSNAFVVRKDGTADLQTELYLGGCSDNGETPEPATRYNRTLGRMEYWDGSAWVACSSGVTIEEIDCGTFVSGYLSSSGAMTNPSSTNKEMTSDYFAVNPSDMLFFMSAMPASHSQWIAFCEYDSSKNFISRRAVVDSVNNASRDGVFRPSSNCAYCRVSMRTFGDLNWTLLKMPVSNNLTGS